MMFVREFRSSVGGKLGAVVAGAVLLLVLGVFLAFGFILLLGLVAAGLLLGLVAALRGRVMGGRAAPLDAGGARHGLDPGLEVRPPPEISTPVKREGADKP
jgi:hypothetical protein